MRRIGIAAIGVLATLVYLEAGQATTVLDNTRAQASSITGGSASALGHRPGVVVHVTAAGGAKAGDAQWADDPSTIDPAGGTVVVVQPKETHAAAPSSPVGTKPGEGTFTGMSFTQTFENDKVSVIRARMEVGAREAFHTHAADTIVVHLSGGEIEDTADGKTVVNRWKPGDVEFEARGSSHSARNIGQAIDVVLVALKP